MPPDQGGERTGREIATEIEIEKGTEGTSITEGRMKKMIETVEKSTELITKKMEKMETRAFINQKFTTKMTLSKPKMKKEKNTLTILD